MKKSLIAFLAGAFILMPFQLEASYAVSPKEKVPVYLKARMSNAIELDKKLMILDLLTGIENDEIWPAYSKGVLKFNGDFSLDAIIQRRNTYRDLYSEIEKEADFNDDGKTTLEELERYFLMTMELIMEREFPYRFEINEE